MNTKKTPKAATIKVMSYNIRHGLGLDTILDLSRSAQVISSEAPDICGLQEIDNYCTRSDSIGQTDYIANRTNMTGTFGKFMDFQKGQYGMATLTTKSIISTKILELPEGKYEPRSSIVHELEIADDCIIAFANVHFDWLSDESGKDSRFKQAKTLVTYLDSLNRPTIITGDFNCTPDSPTMSYFADQGYEFVRKGNNNLSFQGSDKIEIDHLIFRNYGNVKFELKSTYLLDEPIVSDHRPLITTLDLIF